jgi:hypothetical protein
MVEMKNFFDKIIILIFLIIVSSCTVYTRLSNPIDVLAITPSGDTVRIPIRELKPNYNLQHYINQLYNNSNPYNTYNKYYPYLNNTYYPYDYNYNRWNNTVHYDRSIGGNSINTNSSSIVTRKHTSNSVSKKAKIQ